MPLAPAGSIAKCSLYLIPAWRCLWSHWRVVLFIFLLSGPKLCFYLSELLRCIASKCCSEYAIIDQNRRNNLTKTVFRDESEKCLQYDFTMGKAVISLRQMKMLGALAWKHRLLAQSRKCFFLKKKKLKCEPLLPDSWPCYWAVYGSVKTKCMLIVLLYIS